MASCVGNGYWRLNTVENTGKGVLVLSTALSVISPTTAGAINPAIGNGFLRFDDFRALLDDNPSIAHVELANGKTMLNPHLSRFWNMRTRKRSLSRSRSR